MSESNRKRCITDPDSLKTAYPFLPEDTPDERSEKIIKQSQEQAARQRALCHWLFGI